MGQENTGERRGSGDPAFKGEHQCRLPCWVIPGSTCFPSEDK